MPDRQSSVLSSLAEAYALTGREALAQDRLAEALALARTQKYPTPEIFALLVRGRIHAAHARFGEAERDFERGLAISDSTGTSSHTFDLLFERARLDETRHALARAKNRYARLARLNLSFANGSVRAVTLRREAAWRAADLERTLLRRERGLLLLGLATLVLLLLASLVLTARSNRRLALETWRHTLTSRLTGSAMLCYTYETVHQPRRVATQIRKHDTSLARRLDRGRLRGRTELYRCIAHLVFTVERRDISHDAVRMNLQRLFKKNHWDWPTSIERWKAHFKAYPMG